MKRFMSAILLLTFATATCLSAKDFLPLAPGNSWTYRDAVTGQSFTVRVDSTQFYLNQHVYHVLKGYAPDQLLVRVNEYGNIVFWDYERETDVMLTSFEFVPGGWFEAAGRQCPSMGQTQEHPVAHDGPAGAWQALEIKYAGSACADAGELAEHFAENIGMVRRVVNTIAGPRTFDLVHARVGTQSIAAGKFGSFSIAALPGRTELAWNATLRIDQRLSSFLTLHFPSAQIFDARLRDSEGNIVWIWSADKLFDQSQHKFQLGSGWSANITVPYPVVPPGGSQMYTLEAWLTNVEGEPRFAAAAGVEVPLTTDAVFLSKQ